jgi:hypothetical protein
MLFGRVDTAVPGVERTASPSRISRVRNMETWSGSSGPVARAVGRPIVRGAEVPGQQGCLRSECRWPKGDGKTRKRGRPLRRPFRITGRIPADAGRESVLTWAGGPLKSKRGNRSY